MTRRPEDVRGYFRDQIEAQSLALPIIQERGPMPHANWNTHTVAWCVIGPKLGEHRFALQWFRDVRGGPRVRAGCRYKTLRSAWKYIKDRKRGYNSRKYAQAESAIRLMLLTAQRASLPGCRGLKFDASLNPKPKR